MKDPIERQDAIDRITNQYQDSDGGRDRYAVGINVGLTKAMNALKDMPTAEPKHGRWIEYPECLAYAGALDSDYIVCSECGAPFNIMENDAERFDFCPKCGAKMDE